MSLDKINKVVADFERLADEGNKIIAAFQSDLEKEMDWDNSKYWGSVFSDSSTTFLQDYIRDIKTTFRGMIIDQYKEVICPKLNNVYDHIDHVGYRDDYPKFDAVKLVEELNQKILVDLEQITYNQMLRKAKSLMRYCDDNKNTITGYLPLVKEKKGLYRIDTHSLKEIFGFEFFAALLIQNKQLFYRTAPSQFEYEGPVTGFMRNMYAPITADNIGYFQKVSIIRNGTINFRFNNYDDYKTVKEALQGKPPKIYFPEAKIDVTQLFTRDRQTQYKRTVQL